MKTPQRKHTEPRPLRARAEDKLRKQQAPLQALPDAVDSAALVHELQVHQVELEMQNAELAAAHAAAQDAAAKYSGLFEFAPVSYFMLDDQGRIQEVNLAGAALVGLNRSQVTGQLFQKFVPAHYWPVWNKILKDALAGRITQERLVVHSGSTPEPVPVHLAASRLEWATKSIVCLSLTDVGELERATGSINRLTEERTRLLANQLSLEEARQAACNLMEDAESARREAERVSGERQLALDASQLGWFHLDPVTQRSNWDERFREIFGLVDLEGPLSAITARIHPEDRPRVHQVRQAALDPASPATYSVKYRICRPDGSLRWVEVHGLCRFEGTGPERRAIALVGTLADITEAKQQADAVRDSERFKETVLNSLPAHIAVLDQTGRIIAVNAPWRQFAAENDAPPERCAYVGANYLDICRKSSQAGDALARAACEGINAVLHDQIPSFEITYPCHSPTQQRWFSMIAQVIPTGGAVLAHTQVTDQILAQQLVRASEQRYRELVEQTVDGIFVADATGRYIDVNPAGAAMLGYTAEEILQLRIADVITPTEHARLGPEVARFLGSTVARSEWQFRRKDGSVFVGEVMGRQLADGRLQWVVRDVTERKVAERALRESEERFRQVYENAATGIAITDLDGRFNECNPAYSGILGYSVTELRALLFSDVVHPEDRAANLQQVRRLKAGEIKSFEIENRYLHKTGRTVWVRKFVSVLPDAHGQPAFIVALVTDITQRKQDLDALREAESRLRFHIENSGLAVIEFDAALRVSRWTGAAEKIFGWTAAERVGKDVQELGMIPEEEMPHVQETIGRLFREEPGTVISINRNYTKDGRVLHCVWYNSVLVDATGHMQSVLSLVHDNTHRVETEHALARLNAQLEERVRTRTVELEAANRELEAFSYSVSHDLRAPLRAMNGFSRALLEEYGGRLDDQAKGFLERIHTGSERLTRLTDDLLNLARLSRATLHPEAFNLSTAAEQIAAELQQTCPSRPAEFRIRPGLTVQADRNLFQQVLVNLLENAWKYTAPMPHAIIEFGQIKAGQLPPPPEGDTHAVLHPPQLAPETPVYFVRDNGVGFDVAYADKLFSPFQRLHSHSEFPGEGIGLALVQRIVHRHGGRVWANSIVGQGAVFFFTLPVPPPTTTPDAPRQPTP